MWTSSLRKKSTNRSKPKGLKKTVPAVGEVRLGEMFSPAFGVYVDGLFGIGSDKPYEWGPLSGFGLKTDLLANEPLTLP
jgi:hypothetical protein